MELAQDYDLWSQDLLSWLEDIKTISDEKKKVQALACFIAELLPSKSDLLKQALDIAENFNESDKSEKFLTNIIKYLPESEPKILQKTLKIVQGIQDESLRSKALINIVPHLRKSNGEWIQQACEIAQKIDNKYYQARALAFIAPQLSIPESTDVLKQALLIIENDEQPDELAKTLANIASHLANPQSTELLTKALKVLQNIKADLSQAEILTVITTQITDISPQLLQELLAIAQNINYYVGVEAIVFITSNLREIDPEIIEQFLTIAQNITDEFYQVKALAAIAPHVAEHLRKDILRKALELVRKTRDTTYYISVENIKTLISFAVLLDKFEQTEVLQQVLELVQEKIENGVDIFAIVAPQLSNFEPQLLKKIIETVNNLDSEDDQCKALVAITPYLPKSEPALLQQALEIVHKIDDEYARVKALASIAPHLREIQCTEVLQLALEIIENIWQNFTSENLIFIAPYLSKSQPEILQKTFDIVQNIQFNSDQAEALVALLPHLTKLEPKLLQQSLKIALNIKAISRQFDALFAVIPHLPNSNSQVFETALEIVQTTKDGGSRFKALVAVAPHLSESEPNLLHKALEITEGLDDFAKAQALVAIVPQLPKSEPRLIQKALKIADKIERGEQKDEALAAIASQLAGSAPQLLQQYFKTTQDINPYVHQKHLIAIIPYLREPQLTEILQQYLSQSASSLASAAYHLAGNKRTEILQQALEIIENANNSDFYRAIHLKAVVPLLSIAEHKAKVIEIAKTIRNDPFKGSEILAFVATYLPEVEQVEEIYTETIERLKAIDNDSDRARALVAVISHLSNKSSPESLEKIFEIAENIKYQSCQVDDLVILAPHLRAAQCKKLLEQALEKATHIENKDQQTQAFISIVSHLPKSQSQLLHNILEIVQATQDEFRLTDTITAIAPYLHSEAQLIQKFLDIIFQIKQKQNLIKALSQLAFRFPEEVTIRLANHQLSAALEVVKQCENDEDKTKFFSALAPRLSSGLFPIALRIITESIIHPAYRTEAFSNLAPYIPREQKREALELIEKSIPGQYYRTEALCNFIPYLYISQLPKALNIAEDKIQELSLKACILKHIALNLKQGYKNNLYKIEDIQLYTSRLFKIVKDVIKDEADKTAILVELISLVLDFHINQIVDIVNDIRSETYKAKILTNLIISADLSAEHLAKIKDLADTFLDKVAKSQIITSFLKNNLDNQEFDDICSAIADEAYNSPSHIQQTEILTEYAVYARSKQHKALRAIRELNIPILQCKYLERLVPYLQAENWLEAQSVAQEIPDEYYSLKALITLASKFPQFRADAKTQAQNFKNKSENFVRGIELLSSLAIEIPEILPNILKDLERKQSQPEDKLSQWEQKQILIALKPHFPLRIVREIDRERKNARIPDELWYRSLKILRKTYRDALSGGSFRNDTDLNQDLLNLKDEIDALADMLLMRDLEPPVTVGILGGWGGGKSYIMHLMQNRMLEVRSEGINENEAWNENPSSDELYSYVGHIYQIKFDAWTYAKSHLWASLMQTIFLELDRQITLEQQLIAIGIKPCTENSAKVWQVLYQANDDDRKWFLERVLTSEQLQKLQAKEKNIDIQDSLWQILTKSQQDAIISYEATAQKLRDKEETLQEQQAESLNLLNSKKQELQDKKDLLQTHLQNKEAELKQQQDKIIQEKQSAKVKFQPSDKEKHLHLILGYSAVVLESTLGTKGFQKVFDEKIQAEVNQKLKLAEFNIKPENITKLSSFLKGVVTVAISNNYQSITLQTFQQWIKKNRLLITIFLSCLLLAVLIPVIIHFVTKSNPNIIAQLVGFFTPILPAIATLQALLTTGKKWYNETQLALNEYKTSYEQALENRAKELVQQREQEIARELQEDKSISIINAEITALQESINNSSEIAEIEQEIANIETQIERDENLIQLKAEIHHLKIQLEKQQQELPENKYASLVEFISDRLQDDSYERQLGIIHQIKKDLADLSYKILPPPIDSKEYTSKIQDLKKAFPRGPARVILYIDDLDRCPPQTVVEVLEAVQLLVKNRLFIAVIAIDERYINRALAKQYQGVLSRQGRPSPADYLEKIIQIPYRVTPITDSALRQYLKAQVVVQDSATSGNKFNEFAPEEFDILVQCCQEVDLSPRSLKRLTNVYKLFKVLNRIQGHKSTPEEQQAILALLAFSGRYPDLMRDILQDIERRYEESRNHIINHNLRKFFQESLQKNDDKYRDYSYIYQESQKLKHDIDQLIPENSTLEDIKEIFNFVRRFSFVGDIGYDADENGYRVLNQ